MSTPNLLDAVRVVKENEKRASESYAGAALVITQPMGKKLFEWLSEFEKFHYEQLATLEKSLEESGDYKYNEGKEFPLPTITEIKAAEAPNEKSLVTLISQAMELEQLAEKTYAGLAAVLTETQGREIFSRLAEQEHTHYRILRDAYWALNNATTWKWKYS